MFSGRASLALLLAVGAAGHPAAGEEPQTPPAELEPHYIAVLGSLVRPDPGRDTSSHGYGGTFIYGAHVSGPLWLEGRLHGSLFETGSRGGTDFYHYGGGLDLAATVG